MYCTCHGKQSAWSTNVGYMLNTVAYVFTGATTAGGGGDDNRGRATTRDRLFSKLSNFGTIWKSEFFYFLNPIVALS